MQLKIIVYGSCVSPFIKEWARSWQMPARPCPGFGSSSMPHHYSINRNGCTKNKFSSVTTFYNLTKAVSVHSKPACNRSEASYSRSASSYTDSMSAYTASMAGCSCSESTCSHSELACTRSEPSRSRSAPSYTDSMSACTASMSGCSRSEHICNSKTVNL